MQDFCSILLFFSVFLCGITAVYGLGFGEPFLIGFSAGCLFFAAFLNWLEGKFAKEKNE